MNFKTETLRRFAEVLEELKIQADYHEEGFFELKKNWFIIYEEPEALAFHKEKLIDEQLIQLHANGALTYKNGQEVRIKYCNKCGFYFSKKIKHSKDSCPVCGNSSIKYLANNNRIPNWFGNEKKSLLIEEEVIAHLNSCEYSVRENISNIIEKLTGEPRFICVDNEKLQKIEALKKNYPNMKDVIEYIKESVSVCAFNANKAFAIKPILLVGSPGCGKTAFANELSKIIMGKPALKIDLGNDVANFTFTGSDPGYKNARHGLIIESMFAGEDGRPLKNPTILCDELDKIKAEQNYSIQTVFYSILEKSNSTRFFDNYIGVNVDASGVNYICTANSLETIPKPIINRLKVFEIKDYTHEQLKNSVIDHFYEKWLDMNEMTREFLPAVLSEEIKEMILLECKDDTRSIEVAISRVFAQTVTTDSETGHPIALFSAEEMCIGWKNFRGEKKISKKQWRLPVNFLADHKGSKLFSS